MNHNKLRQNLLANLLTNEVGAEQALGITTSFLGRFSVLNWPVHKKRMQKIMRRTGTALIQTADKLVK